MEVLLGLTGSGYTILFKISGSNMGDQDFFFKISAMYYKFCISSLILLHQPTNPDIKIIHYSHIHTVIISILYFLNARSS